MSGYTRGRTTIYKGVRMRSRLEASFAAVLDSIDEITWAYEPQCFADQTGQYLPDFLVVNDGLHDYMEVKPPQADTSAALLAMHVIRSSEPQANLYVWVPTGNYPNQGWTVAAKCPRGEPCAHCRGAEFSDERVIPSTDRMRMVIRREPPTDPATARARIGGQPRGGYPKCSQEETDAFLADRPWPRP